MKVLIVTPHFYPENFKCNDMAFELNKRGHDVTVMTAIPDYPAGKYHAGYGIFKRRRECVNGVKIHRSFIIPRGSGSSIRLALNYISYSLFSTIKALWFGLIHKYDTIIVHETSPVMVGIPAAIIKRLQHIPMVFWVLDLWPESLSAAVGINNKLILGLFNKLTRCLYENSDMILIGSKGYRTSINNKGAFDAKIHYFPNWVENELASDLIINDGIPKLPDGFNVMIAGNMGDAQDLPHVMDAATKLRDSNINFIFVGNGRKKSYVEEFARNHGLHKQVFCLGQFPLAAMPSLFSQADVLFMALKDDPIFALTVPSRLQAYMSSGKPVISMINGEGAELIQEADCGWSVPAGDSEALAELLKKISLLDKSKLVSKGLNGKRYSELHFNFEQCIDNLEQFIKLGNHKEIQAKHK